jgi:hypothetical protein
MSKAFASVVCICMSALALIGCAGEMTNARQAGAAPPAAGADVSTYYGGGTRVYAARAAAAPTAIVVLLPAISVEDSQYVLARGPALWAAQGFDVVAPEPAEIYRSAVDEQVALARLFATAPPPIWLVGAGPAIDAALATAAQPGRGRTSSVVITSVTSQSGSCSESVLYSDAGTGAGPKVEVSKSGDCEAGSSVITGRQPSVLPASPPARPGSPRIIEASTAPKGLSPAAQVQSLAQLIKTSPPS